MPLHRVTRSSNILVAQYRAVRGRNKQQAFWIWQIERRRASEKTGSEQLDYEYNTLTYPKIALCIKSRANPWLLGGDCMYACENYERHNRPRSSHSVSASGSFIRRQRTTTRARAKKKSEAHFRTSFVASDSCEAW